MHSVELSDHSLQNPRFRSSPLTWTSPLPWQQTSARLDDLTRKQASSFFWAGRLAGWLARIEKYSSRPSRPTLFVARVANYSFSRDAREFTELSRKQSKRPSELRKSAHHSKFEFPSPWQKHGRPFFNQSAPNRIRRAEEKCNSLPSLDAENKQQQQFDLIEFSTHSATRLLIDKWYLIET